DLVVRRLQQVYQFAMEFGPKIVISIIILLIGWICAVLIKKITAKLLKALGFDVLSDKFGAKGLLERGGIQRNSSSLIGLGFYWLIIFSTLIMIFNTLELPVASQLLKQVVLYIPKFIVALILLALGIFLSNFVGKLAGTSERLAKIPFHVAIDRV
ncbi:MAG: hypothetical protein JSW40_04920, partial [Candidatus Omnitrophota bacterium]